MKYTGRTKTSLDHHVGDVTMGQLPAIRNDKVTNTKPRNLDSSYNELRKLLKEIGIWNVESYKKEARKRF